MDFQISLPFDMQVQIRQSHLLKKKIESTVEPSFRRQVLLDLFILGMGLYAPEFTQKTGEVCQGQLLGSCFDSGCIIIAPVLDYLDWQHILLSYAPKQRGVVSIGACPLKALFGSYISLNFV